MENTIKTMRKKKKITQTELAQKLHISPKSLSCYERGYVPSLSVAHRIATFFGVEIKNIFKLT
jgi:DNA-binding XRE family transcriptional regulator